MKIFALSSLLTYSTLASAALAAAQRPRRDVNELTNEYLSAAPVYLPPAELKTDKISGNVTAEVTVEPVADTTLPPESAVLGAQGYEYRTIRRLKLRHRRDVSHLAQEYLPPPHNDYLPPTAALITAAEGKDTEEIVTAQVINEYLPPEEQRTAAAHTLNSSTEAEAPVSVTTATELVPAADAVEVHNASIEPQYSGILLADGYHYKQAAELPTLDEAEAVQYLPPLNVQLMTDALPEEQDSRLLADDGYNYRTIKRYKLKL